MQSAGLPVRAEVSRELYLSSGLCQCERSKEVSYTIYLPKARITTKVWEIRFTYNYFSIRCMPIKFVQENRCGVRVVKRTIVGYNTGRNLL
jgi:hypothetical protein